MMQAVAAAAAVAECVVDRSLYCFVSDSKRHDSCVRAARIQFH